MPENLWRRKYLLSSEELKDTGEVRLVDGPVKVRPSIAALHFFSEYSKHKVKLKIFIEEIDRMFWYHMA